MGARSPVEELVGGRWDPMPPALALTPTSPRGRLRQVWPFLATFALALALSLLSAPGHGDRPALIAAGLLTIAVGTAVLLVPWPRASDWWTLAPVVAVGLIVHLLRAASGSGTSAGYTSLLLLPVVWQALHRRPPVLFASIAAVTTTNLAGLLLLDSPVSLAAQWRSLILFAVTALGVGLTVNRLSRERTDLLEQVARLATHDPLTGLHNRRGWEQLALAAALVDLTRPTTVAMLDLDRFKAYNDEHGHDRGDQLLVASAEAWRGVVRDDDLLVRWGGEEFALLLPGTDAATAELVLGRLQAAMPAGQTFSAGLATYRPAAEPDRADLAEALERADAALYRSKRDGRARITHADAGPDRSLGRRR